MLFPLNNSEKEIELLKDAIKHKDEEILDILSRLTEMEKKIDSLSKSKANSTDKSSNCNFLINDSETLTVHKEKPHDSSSEQVENTVEICLNVMFVTMNPQVRKVSVSTRDQSTEI